MKEKKNSTSKNKRKGRSKVRNDSETKAIV